MGELIPGVTIIQDLTGQYAFRECIPVLKVCAIVILGAFIVAALVIAISSSSKKYLITILPVAALVVTMCLMAITYSTQSGYTVYKVIVEKKADEDVLYEQYEIVEDNGSTKILKSIERQDNIIE